MIFLYSEDRKYWKKQVKNFKRECNKTSKALRRNMKHHEVTSSRRKATIAFGFLTFCKKLFVDNGY